MNIKIRLTALSFLQFGVWGAYLTSMGTYLSSIGLGNEISLFYSMQGFVSILIPAMMGIIADRWVPAQRLLGICHLIAGVFLGLAGYYGMQNEGHVKFNILFLLYSVSVMFYMPTIALFNSVAYSILVKNNFETMKVFPTIRTFGTVGFIFTMLFVNFTGVKDGVTQFSFVNEKGFLSFQNTHVQFFVSAILGIVLFLYSFTLPNCPINKNEKKKSLYDALGLEAFSLFKYRKMAIFFVFSMLLGVSLQITNGYANPFISSFKEIPEYAKTWGVNNANALISLSQVSETLCILLIPFFLKRYGIKVVMLIAMFSWFLRFGFFVVGDPGSGVWMFILSMIVYGVAFDFFNVSGSLFVDLETNENIRSSAQGIFMMMTNGLGATIGTLIAGSIINHYQVFSDNVDSLTKLSGWHHSWGIFSLYSLVVAVVFMVVFKYKHKS